MRSKGTTTSGEFLSSIAFHHKNCWNFCMTQYNLSVLKVMISPQSFKQDFSVKVFHVHLDFIHCSAHLCFKKSDLITFIFLLFTYLLLYLGHPNAGLNKARELCSFSLHWELSQTRSKRSVNTLRWIATRMHVSLLFWIHFETIWRLTSVILQFHIICFKTT